MRGDFNKLRFFSASPFGDVVAEHAQLKYRAAVEVRALTKADVWGLALTPELNRAGGRNHRPRGSRQSVTLRCGC